MSEPCYLGFDSQSEIWSPLVPRFHYLTDDDYEDEDDHDFFMAKSKRVVFEEVEKHPLEKLKKFTMNVHRKISIGTAKKKKKKKKENGMGKSPSPVRLPSKKVQHLIEKCLLSYMTKEECMEALSTHANIKPVITSTVWKELEKENKGFFEAYWRNKEDYTRGNDTTKMMMTMNMHSNSSSTKESQD